MEIKAALGSAASMSNGRRTAEVAARGSLLLVGLVGGLGALAGNLLGGGGLREGELDIQLLIKTDNNQHEEISPSLQ